MREQAFNFPVGESGAFAFGLRRRWLSIVATRWKAGQPLGRDPADRIPRSLELVYLGDEAEELIGHCGC